MWRSTVAQLVIIDAGVIFAALALALSADRAAASGQPSQTEVEQVCASTLGEIVSAHDSSTTLTGKTPAIVHLSLDPRRRAKSGHLSIMLTPMVVESGRKLPSRRVRKSALCAATH